MRYWIYFWLTIILTTITFAQSDTTVCGSLVTGWNLVSIPVDAVDRSAMTNFGVPHVYEYIIEPWIGYRPADTLEGGHSYWIRNGTTCTVCFLGKSKYVDTIEVRIGWNFIGSLSDSFIPDSTTLHVIPSGTVTVILPNCDFPTYCSVSPGLGFIAKINSNSPNPRLVMRVK